MGSVSGGRSGGCGRDGDPPHPPPICLLSGCAASPGGPTPGGAPRPERPLREGREAELKGGGAGRKWGSRVGRKCRADGGL